MALDGVLKQQTVGLCKLTSNHFPNSVSGQDLNCQPSPWQDQRKRRKKTQLLENEFNYYFLLLMYCKLLM